MGSLPPVGDANDITSSSEPLPTFIKPVPRSLNLAHMKFLRSQGALSLPGWSLQRALIEAYAEFAYPYMPLIQIHEFLDSAHDPESSSSRQISLLLYQAILFAGSAFVDRRSLEGDQSCFSSRRLARRELSNRVTV